MSDLRFRHQPIRDEDRIEELSSSSDQEDSTADVHNPRPGKEGENTATRGKNTAFVSVLDIFRFIFFIFLASSALSYYVTSDSILWGYKPWFTRLPVLIRYLVCLAQLRSHAKKFPRSSTTQFAFPLRIDSKPGLTKAQIHYKSVALYISHRTNYPYTMVRIVLSPFISP